MSDHDTWNMFAAAALTGLVANPGGPIQANTESGWGYTNCDAEAVGAVVAELANALLIESKKREKPEPIADPARNKLVAALRAARAEIEYWHGAEPGFSVKHAEMTDTLAAIDAALSGSSLDGMKPIQGFTREKPAEPTPPQPDDDGWIKWDGSEYSEDWPIGEDCPPEVRGKTIDVRFRDGEELLGIPAGVHLPGVMREASHCFWENSGAVNDIVAYRIVSDAGVTK